MKTTFNHTKLALAREQMKYSLDDVSRQLYAIYGVETVRETIARWENGETSPDAKILGKLAAILELSVEDLYVK